jgi:hypothetical protein
MLPQAPELVIDYKDLKLAGIIAAGGGGVVAKGRFGPQKVGALGLKEMRRRF